MARFNSCLMKIEAETILGFGYTDDACQQINSF